MYEAATARDLCTGDRWSCLCTALGARSGSGYGRVGPATRALIGQLEQTTNAISASPAASAVATAAATSSVAGPSDPLFDWLSFFDSHAPKPTWTPGYGGWIGQEYFGNGATDDKFIDCSSDGAISSNGGGIFGASYSSATASNSYTSGLGSGTGGIYAGSSTDGTGNYSEANNGGSGWSDTNARSALSSLSTTWVSPGTDMPFDFAEMDASPYSHVGTRLSSGAYVLDNDFSQTVEKGGSTVAALSSYDTCQMLSISGGAPASYADITMDPGTGVISTTDHIDAGTYDIAVNCNNIQGGYSESAFHLTVNN